MLFESNNNMGVENVNSRLVIRESVINSEMLCTFAGMTFVSWPVFLYIELHAASRRLNFLTVKFNISGVYSR